MPTPDLIRREVAELIADSRLSPRTTVHQATDNGSPGDVIIQGHYVWTASFRTAEIVDPGDIAIRIRSRLTYLRELIDKELTRFDQKIVHPRPRRKPQSKQSTSRTSSTP